MSARNVCRGTRPSRYVSYRAISAPPSRPEQATVTLQFTPKMGARIVQKVLKSAVANALHEGKVRLEELYVKEAVVGAGPTLKRWLPRAQGRATPLLKRTSHVSVTVATKESL